MKRILKYPGSKWRIASDIIKLLPKHRSYVEPYFGSGAVLFNKAVSPIETINDMDNDVVNLFEIIRDDPDKLVYLLQNTPYARYIYESSIQCVATEKYEKAMRFLIRCWQGHGFRTNTNQSGWKHDVQGREKAYALYDWMDLPKRIDEVSQRLRQVQIDNRPALDVIKRFNHNNVLMYLDPPYVMDTRRDKRDQYKHEMSIEEHVALLHTVKDSKAKVIISGYACDLYDGELKTWNRKVLISNDAKGKRTQEIVWMNYDPPVQMTISDFMKE